MLGPLQSVVIEKMGALTPEDEGFKPHIWGDFQGQVMRNPDDYGFDRWRAVSDSGYYFRTLTEAEKDFAIQRDWNLTCVCALERGYAFAAVDFGPGREVARFDIVLMREHGKYFVGLTTNISPAWNFDKHELPIVADIDHPHTFQLRYDHASRRAALWVDGNLLASDYKGVEQFKEDRGVFFGSWATREETSGIGVFRSVRFEAR